MQKKSIGILVGIFLFASLLRFAYITRHDSYTDEAILALRAIGLMDYDASPMQTTPWQWFPAVPWWARLSLHDHPLGFLVLQHWAMQFLGETVLAARFPAVLAGIASVYLVYCLGRKLFGEKAGLLAAALSAVQSYLLWVSRLGIQDGVVIVILLLALWLLFSIREKPRNWLWLGVVSGLGIVTKYTIVIIFPMMLLYFFLYRIRFWKEKYFWGGLCLLVLFSMPAWLYNIMLYRATGHFDFQLSSAFHQVVPEWEFRLGRSQVGDLSDRFINFFRALGDGNSLWFNLTVVGSLIVLVVRFLKEREKELTMLLGITLLMYLWFFVLGSTYRFVVMIVPFFVLCLGKVFSMYWQRYQFVISFFFVLELLFSLNSFFFLRPLGSPGITYAPINKETQNVGFNQLAEFLNLKFIDAYSLLVGEPAYPFLKDIVTSRIDRAVERGYHPRSVLIVYDRDINFLARLWYLDRYTIYDGWPIMSDERFFNYTKGEFDAFYRAQGVKEFIYIAPATPAVEKSVTEKQGGERVVEEYLKKKGIAPRTIKSSSGTSAFFIYEF